MLYEVINHGAYMTSQITKDLYASLNMVRRQRRLPQVAVGNASETELRAAIEFEFDALAGKPAKNEILIHLGKDGWLATYTGPHAFEISELFDGPTIQTAYTAHASREFVIAEIQKRNPGVVVRNWIALVSNRAA